MKVKSKTVKRKPINSKRSLKSKLKRGTSKKKIKIKRKNKSKTLKQKGGDDTCQGLIQQLKTTNTQGKYKNADKNPFILANLISSIVNKCGEEKSLEVRPLILLDKNMVGKSFNSELPQEYDELLYHIKKYLKDQQLENEDKDDGDDHTNEIIFNLKTEWFRDSNISDNRDFIDPIFRKIMYNILKELPTKQLEQLKSDPNDENINQYFIKGIGARLLEDFNKIHLKDKSQTFQNMKWRMKGGANPSSNNKEENKLKSKMRIMNPMYKIAYHMLNGKLGEQSLLSQGQYSLWLKEIYNIYQNKVNDEDLGLLKEYYDYFKSKKETLNLTETKKSKNVSQENTNA